MVTAFEENSFLGMGAFWCHLKIARHNNFSALYVQVCTQQQKLRFVVCCETSQVWLFFALVAIFRSSLSSKYSLRFRASCRFNKICENCKKNVSLTIFCVTCDFWQFFVMLISWLFSAKSFRFTCHFGISLSAHLKHIYTQKPVQPIFK